MSVTSKTVIILRLKEWISAGGQFFFEARVSSGSEGGCIEIRLDSPDGILAGTCAVSNTGGWEIWKTVGCSVKDAAGVHNLYLVFTGGIGSLLKLNWWKFK